MQQIIDNNPDDIFVWCDGSVRRSVPQCSAACAIVISSATNIMHEHSTAILTHSIATAEFCGVLNAYQWISKNPTITQPIHILCDNQFVVKSCLNLCKSGHKHAIFTHAIRLLQQRLSNHSISLHWIPSHTDNHFHSTCDKLAHTTATSNQRPIDPKRFIYHTDASASGRELASP